MSKSTSRLTRPITVRLPNDIVDGVEKDVLALGISRSEVVTRRLRRAEELAREVQNLRQQDRILNDDHQPIGEVLK